MKKVIKVCINPCCDEVAHNCDKKETRCRNCHGLLVEINKETYLSKFSNNQFQYNYSNESRTVVMPTEVGYSFQLSLNF